MEIRILGEVTVRGPDGPVLLQRVGERLLLAVLAIEVRRLVPAERLLNLIGEDGDISAGTLIDYASAIRRALTAAGGSRTMLPHARNGAYILEVDPDQVDYQHFRRLNSAAADHATAGKHTAAIAAYQQALDLWTGPPLANVRAGADGLRQRLHDEYQGTVYKLVTQQLHAGDHDQALATITRLLHEQVPTDQLIVLGLHTLARAGRHADIPTLLTRVTQRMQAMAGAQPGEQVRQLARRLLADPGQSRTLLLAGPGPDRAPAGDEQRLPDHPGPAGRDPTWRVPRQLPTRPQMFTGRAVELADLEKLHDASTVVITAIDGMAGVGKTALAVQAAHQMVDRYPDGQLFIDLHGYTDGVPPIESGEALERMLRALGVPGEQIPAGVDERAGLYRSRLADERMVIVLDNAATEAQVTPLLPGAPGCVVLVTSRRRLAGLDHTHTLSLDTLPAADAVALFRRSVSESRLAAQPPELVAELVELCGRLPLAIRIAAARLRAHNAWDLTYLVARLRDQRHRLAELSAGQRSVAAALDLSYQDLGADLRRAYRLLGLHAGPDIEPSAAAALLDTAPPEAGRLLDQLLEAHLLQELVPGRYRFHDLIRAHAAHTASWDETDDGRRLAVARLLDYYRHASAVAMDAAYPYERERRPQVSPAGIPIPDLADPASALGWLDGELPNLLAAAAYAAEHDRPENLLHLSTILHWHLRSHGRLRDAVTLHQRALSAARSIGDRAGELEALALLGNIHLLEGRHEQATDQYRQALRLARATRHHPGELDALIGVGYIHLLQGRYEQARDHYQQAIRLARGSGHRTVELEALVGLGRIQLTQGQYEQAADHFEQGLRLARAAGHRRVELSALSGLGHIHRLQGRYERAIDRFEQARQLAHAAGHQTAELNALTGLGHIHRMQGRHRQAADHYQRVLDLADRSGNRNYRFEAWQGLGRLQHATGHPDTALTHHHRALALASELGQPGDQARAHDGLAHAHHMLHQHEQARSHWQHALDILTRLGVDHTDEEETTVAAIRGHLGHDAG